MSNGYGNYHTTLAASMRAYDAAPPLLRYAMQNAVGKWAAKPLTDLWRGGWPEAELISMIRNGDLTETRATYGDAHPEAQPARRLACD